MLVVIQGKQQDYRGDLKGFPYSIVQKMLYYQEQQSGVRNITVFERSRSSGNIPTERGFTWEDTPEGGDFWENVIRNRKFNEYFSKYPRENTDIHYKIL